MGIVLSLAAFAASWWYGRRSLGAGMAVVLTAGYFYGIVRANFLDSFTFFLYDSAVLGLYLARFTLPNAFPPRNSHGLTIWFWLLIGWPLLMFALCSLFPQHPLIQLVGLRFAIWYLPVLILGASARLQDLNLVARTLAVLNLITLVFAAGEYFLGLEVFYPKNDITALIYRSNDVAGHTAYRIPATFNFSAAYGGTMVATIPWLVGRWQAPGLAFLERCLFGFALLAVMLGTFVCGSRSPVIMLALQGGFLAYYFRTQVRYIVAFSVLIILVSCVVFTSDRLQRISTLQDTSLIEQRINVCLHVGIIDMIVEYPLGAGLGSAFGTNIPSFLLHLVDKAPLGAENEYARIELEEGLVGLGIWLAFLTWFFLRRRAVPYPSWKLGFDLMFSGIFLCWSTAFIGSGMLAAIPQSLLLLFQMGVLARDYSHPPTRAPIDRIERRVVATAQ